MLCLELISVLQFEIVVTKISAVFLSGLQLGRIHFLFFVFPLSPLSSYQYCVFHSNENRYQIGISSAGELLVSLAVFCELRSI